MGYTTDFYGTLQFNKPMTKKLGEYINKFSETRRMARDNDKIKEVYPNWKELCYNGELGTEGEYFVGDDDRFNFFTEQDPSVLNYNGKPSTQPGLWCQWIIDENGELAWDGGEKFYHYIEWLEYLIKNFFEPEGYILNGQIKFQGEDPTDKGTIVVENNTVKVY